MDLTRKTTKTVLEKETVGPAITGAVEITEIRHHRPLSALKSLNNQQ